MAMEIEIILNMYFRAKHRFKFRNYVDIYEVVCQCFIFTFIMRIVCCCCCC
jgi:hypothetical protein